MWGRLRCMGEHFGTGTRNWASSSSVLKNHCILSYAVYKTKIAKANFIIRERLGRRAFESPSIIRGQQIAIKNNKAEKRRLRWMSGVSLRKRHTYVLALNLNVICLLPLTRCCTLLSPSWYRPRALGNLGFKGINARNSIWYTRKMCWCSWLLAFPQLLET